MTELVFIEVLEKSRLIPVFVLVTIGLVKVARKLGLPKKISPVVALVFGELLSFLSTSITGITDTFALGVIGIIIGLTSVGLYSSVKNISETVQ